MAKPNYSFEKRQRELAKKKKKVCPAGTHKVVVKKKNGKKKRKKVKKIWVTTGAGDPDFNWLDMAQVLRERGVIRVGDNAARAIISARSSSWSSATSAAVRCRPLGMPSRRRPATIRCASFSARSPSGTMTAVGRSG